MYAKLNKWLIGPEIGGATFNKKFDQFPESDGEFTLRIIEFIDEDNEKDDR